MCEESLSLALAYCSNLGRVRLLSAQLSELSSNLTTWNSERSVSKVSEKKFSAHLECSSAKWAVQVIWNYKEKKLVNAIL